MSSKDSRENDVVQRDITFMAHQRRIGNIGPKLNKQNFRFHGFLILMMSNLDEKYVFFYVEMVQRTKLVTLSTFFQ